MKNNRHKKILELIEKYDIDTQDELCKRLEEAGFSVTQATVSRDIKELRLIKVSGHKSAYCYAHTGRNESAVNDRMIRLLSDSTVSVDFAGQIVVVKTLSGSANVAAEVIDNMNWTEVLGTIAGDNTIFIAVREKNDASEISSRIQRIINGQKLSGERGAQ